MAAYFRFRRPYIRWTGYFEHGFFSDDELEREQQLELTDSD